MVIFWQFKILSLRFFDGDQISIAEFIEYFTTDPRVRQAKAAASAVRASLDILQLQERGENEVY